VHAYDALHDREAMACWQRAFHAAASGHIDPDSDLQFHRLPGHDLDLEAHSTLFSGQQSNSSVAFGEDAIMKVFRKVTPGVNPDIQIHEVLTNVGSDHVADLYGWLDAVVDCGEGPTTVQLAMLQRFLRTATDGWDLALASVRNLYAEPEVHASESGGDFAAEAARLGEALAEVHRDLATHFPTERRGPEATAALASAMTARLDAAIGAVPELAPYGDALRAVFARVADLEELEVQKIHGDLHLGQTLRTSLGWKLVDFEGEPAKPLPERLLPDSRWRDVAGMLRSFDYAAHAVLHQQPDLDPQVVTELEELLAQRANEWANRARNHFLVAYGGDLTRGQRVLLDAYVADKAVYETVYEARNRPSWIDIPLEAVARIGAS
jgi:maltokinase